MHFFLLSVHLKQTGTSEAAFQIKFQIRSASGTRPGEETATDTLGHKSQITLLPLKLQLLEFFD